MNKELIADKITKAYSKLQLPDIDSLQK